MEKWFTTLKRYRINKLILKIKTKHITRTNVNIHKNTLNLQHKEKKPWSDGRKCKDGTDLVEYKMTPRRDEIHMFHERSYLQLCLRNDVFNC